MPPIADSFWQRVRTPYGSFIAVAAGVVMIAGCAFDYVESIALSILLLYAWGFYVCGWCCFVRESPAASSEQRQAARVQWSLREMLVVTACIAAIGGAIVHRWPLQWRFAISRAELDRFADQLENGSQVQTPTAVGLFVIKEAEVRRGLPCLWTDPDPAGHAGFVRCTTEQAHRFNLGMGTQSINARWQFIRED